MLLTAYRAVREHSGDRIVPSLSLVLDTMCTYTVSSFHGTSPHHRSAAFTIATSVLQQPDSVICFNFPAQLQDNLLAEDLNRLRSLKSRRLRREWRRDDDKSLATSLLHGREREGRSLSTLASGLVPVAQRAALA